MRQLLCILLSLLAVTACTDSGRSLSERARELCAHIPDPERLEASRDYLTEDFYASIAEMIALPDPSPVLHEWEFWYVSADGTPIAEDACEVLSVERQDATHAQVLVQVQPADPDYEAETHILLMEKVRGRWLLSDFDDTKQACRRRIESAAANPA